MSTDSFRSADAATLAWLEGEARFFDEVVMIFSDIRPLLSVEAPTDALRAEAERVRHSVEAGAIVENGCPIAWRRAQQARIGWCNRLARRLEEDVESGMSSHQAIAGVLAKLDRAECGIQAALAAATDAVLSA